MSQSSLRNLIGGLRAAALGSGPASRLQLSISTQPQQPLPPLGAVAVPGAGADAPLDQHGSAAEQEERLLGGGAAGLGPVAPAEPPAEPLPAASSPPGLARDGSTGHELGDVAAAAERHRLTNLSSSVDLRAVAIALERGLPL